MTEQAESKAYEKVFDYLQAEILSGRLKLNDKLPTERQLAAQLSVSRNSAREALHVLEMMGMMECRQGSGDYLRCDPGEHMARLFYLSSVLRGTSLKEVFETRVGIERTALSLAVTRATDAEISAMETILLNMDLPMRAEESAVLDLQFHRQLMVMSHNSLVQVCSDMMNGLTASFIRDLRVSILKDRRRADSLRKAHWDIFRAIAQHDENAGMRAMDRHFAVVRKHIDRLDDSVQQ